MIKKNADTSSKKTLNDFFDDLFSFIRTEKEYILFCIKYISLQKKEDDKSKMIKTQVRLLWTATKIDLVELIYALYHARCINNGEAEIKNITEAFESLFNIDLGKYYRTYIDVTRRKINRSKFLSSLITLVEKEMIERDCQ